MISCTYPPERNQEQRDSTHLRPADRNVGLPAQESAADRGIRDVIFMHIDMYRQWCKVGQATI